MHLEALLLNLGVLFTVAVAVVLVLRRARVPSIVGFLLAGVLVGPNALGLVQDTAQVELLAELGVALVLFTVGLELSLGQLARQRRSVVVGGGLQVALTLALGSAVATGVGSGWQTGVFWGCLVTLSSTAIVLRGLEDRGESSTPHGRLVLGVLIFQDLCIVPMMLALPLLAGETATPGTLGPGMLRAAAVITVVLVLARTGVPRLLNHVAATRDRALFLLTVLGIALAVATATASVGLSLALGAFVAGIVIADTEFVHQAGSDVAPFRDAFASLFFVSIGMLLDPRILIDRTLLVLGVTVAIVLGKLAIATLAAMLLRLPARVALRTGVALAQVGEFSFVLLRAGQDHGLVSDAGARVFLAASVLTMAAAPVLLAAGPLIARAAGGLRPLERLLRAREPDAIEVAEPLHDHVVVAGLGLGGQLLLTALAGAGVSCVGLELDPVAVRRLRADGHVVRYGDVTRPEVLEKVAELDRARLLVLLLSDDAATVRVASVARQAFPDLPVIARAHRTHRDRSDLAQLGIELVWEDYEAALEMIERVLHRVDRPMLGDAVAKVRGTRGAAGNRKVEVAPMLEGMAFDSLTLSASAWAIGRTIASSGLRQRAGVLVLAVARGDDVHATPAPDEALEPGDVLFLFGSRTQLDAARALLEGGVEAAG